MEQARDRQVESSLSPPSPSSRVPVGPVVHLLPKDLARGAQVFARTLRDRLDQPATPHRTVTLFRGPAGALEPDHRLDVAPGRLRRLGFDPRVVPRLRRLLRSLSPSVVVAHGGEPLKYAALALPAGTRLVAYKIGSRHESLRGGVQMSWHRRLLRRADRVVAISDDVADEAVSAFGCDPARVVVIPNGRDPALYRPASPGGSGGAAGASGSADAGEVNGVEAAGAFGLADAGEASGAGSEGRDPAARGAGDKPAVDPRGAARSAEGDRSAVDRAGGVAAVGDVARDLDGVVRVVYVGHVEPAKRPLWFVEIVRRLSARHPQVRGVLVGEGPRVDEVREAAAGLPIDVLGRRDDVPALLAAADVLVLPSQREGMPGVLVEAGLLGLPVVTTDVSGARDIVDEGVTGYVVPADDLDLLTERTAQLVADPALRRALGNAARQRCVERFSLDAVARAWSDLLAELTQSTGVDVGVVAGAPT